MVGYVYLQSDAVASIYFAAHFVRLLFKGGYYSRAATIRGRHLSLWKAWRNQRQLDPLNPFHTTWTHSIPLEPISYHLASFHTTWFHSQPLDLNFRSFLSLLNNKCTFFSNSSFRGTTFSKHWCCGGRSHCRSRTDPGCYCDNHHCCLEACVSYSGVLDHFLTFHTLVWVVTTMNA